MTDTSPAAEWPLALDDPTRAVHFALEPNCPYARPADCPRETETRQTIGAYLTWLSAHAAEQPPQVGQTAPHGPHNPADAPEGPATRDRAAGGHTAPPVWVDGDPLMLAIATAIWDQCRLDDPDMPTNVYDDSRTIAAVAAHVIRNAPDSQTDSPDSGQDSAPDTKTGSRPTSADTARTAPSTDATIRRQLDQIVNLRETVIQSQAERDQAYRERAHLLAWIASLHPANAVITTAEDIDDEPGWQLLYLLVGGWQMSWHIAPRDSELFAHVEHVPADDPRAQWDGHSTTEKYRRIQGHTARLSQANTTREH